MRLEKNGTVHNGATSGAGGNGYASNGTSPTSQLKQSNGFATELNNGVKDGVAAAVERPTAPYQGHDREELSRILIQALEGMGYTQSARALEEESGHRLESPMVTQFRQAVMRGEWGRAEQLLHGFEIHEDADFNALLFCLRQQKFLELLERGDSSKALAVLRAEITPLNRSTERLHFLSSLMLCYSAEDLKQQAEWDGAAGTSRQHLLSELSNFISPSIMIPEHRLASLLTQIKQVQIARCLYHNTSNVSSLYCDHVCDRSQFPQTTIRVLDDHHDEVYVVKFSNDGKRMASGSQSGVVMLWDVEDIENLRQIQSLAEHEKEVTNVEWSPDDSLLVTCSKDHTAKIWDTKTGACQTTLTGFTEDVSACAWTADGQTLLTASLGRSLILWDVYGHKIREAPSPRLYDIKITPDGSKLVGVGTTEELHVFDFDDWDKKRSYSFEKTMLSCVDLSRDNKHAMVVTGKECLLVEIDTGCVVHKYKGAQFLLKDFRGRGCFGGSDENFILSGSEDSHIYVWHKDHGNMVEKLPGHVGPVNHVDWNPRNSAMFASAGDDGTIRIWARPPQQTSQSKGKMKTGLGVR